VRRVRKTVTRRVVRKSAVKKYVRRIGVFKKQLKTAPKQQKKVIRRKILRFRVIKGGNRFVRRYVRRCNFRIR
jgi:hypothetical protein